MGYPYTRSTFSRVRLVLNPQEMILDTELRSMPPKAFAVFMWLLPYACYGTLPTEFRIMARLLPGMANGASVRSAWKHIGRYFDMQDGQYVLKPQRWLAVSLESDDRQPLRHLFGQLVEFWGRACVYCGATDKMLHVEHIIPRVRGGSDALTNLTLACPKCNLSKNIQTAAEFGFPEIHERAMRLVKGGNA